MGCMDGQLPLAKGWLAIQSSVSQMLMDSVCAGWLAGWLAGLHDYLPEVLWLPIELGGGKELQSK